VKYESISEESFFDISLNLLGCKDIYASLDDYVREEKLEGENKYDTGKREFLK
jgi:ubiquitin carboxyl-terminal hydrolase 7